MENQQKTPYDHIIQKMFDHGISRLKPKDQKTLKTLLAIIIGRTKGSIVLIKDIIKLMTGYVVLKRSGYASQTWNIEEFINIVDINRGLEVI